MHITVSNLTGYPDWCRGHPLAQVRTTDEVVSAIVASLEPSVSKRSLKPKLLTSHWVL